MKRRKMARWMGGAQSGATGCAGSGSLGGGGVRQRTVQSHAMASGATVQVDSTPGKDTTVSVECSVAE
ncbi:MAG TPA: hypothetical protein PKY96_11785 [Flavobacteriales bacterium]|nr:hypothetical protein [Flavobacteriales bacterium]